MDSVNTAIYSTLVAFLGVLGFTAYVFDSSLNTLVDTILELKARIVALEKENDELLELLELGSDEESLDNKSDEYEDGSVGSKRRRVTTPVESTKED